MTDADKCRIAFDEALNYVAGKDRDNIWISSAGEMWRCSWAASRKSIDEESVLQAIRKWKLHWQMKEPGYAERALAVDANMMHHLAKVIHEHVMGE